MATINVNSIQTVNTNNISSIVCRTPKIPKNVEDRCSLVTSVDDLILKFGNPYIDPLEYSDLIIIYYLVSTNHAVYVSSLYDMKDNKDDDIDWSIKYNGYTEFKFRDPTITDSIHYDISYKLKSDIKFCQPIIQSEYHDKRLDISVSLFEMNRRAKKSVNSLNALDVTRLYSIYHFIFVYDNSDDANNDVHDSDVISALSNIGVELHIEYHNDNSKTPETCDDLIKRLSSFNLFNVTPSFQLYDASGNPDATIIENNVKELGYYYDLHNDMYSYEFSDKIQIYNEYINATNRIVAMKIPPRWLCLGKLYESNTEYNNGHIISSSMIDLDKYSYSLIHSSILNNIGNESDIYLFINMPDVSVSTATDLLSGSAVVEPLPYNYNCDLFFGYTSDYIISALMSGSQSHISHATSVLTMGNIVANNTQYMTNSVAGLNISNKSVKLIISENAAKNLSTLRCNSLVLFDIGSPSVFGNKSLSNFSNLQYSHISRNLVYIRRLIREYIETKKFMLLTLYNVQLCINYIERNILDNFVSSGILNRYSVKHSIENKTTYIKVSLLFYETAQSITLNFNI